MTYGNSNINGISNADSSSGSMDSGNTIYALTDDDTGEIYDTGKSMVGN